jgi:hypothetical protein
MILISFDILFHSDLQLFFIGRIFNFEGFILRLLIIHFSS